MVCYSLYHLRYPPILLIWVFLLVYTKSKKENGALCAPGDRPTISSMFCGVGIYFMVLRLSYLLRATSFHSYHRVSLFFYVQSNVFSSRSYLIVHGIRFRLLSYPFLVVSVIATVTSFTFLMRFRRNCIVNLRVVLVKKKEQTT